MQNPGNQVSTSRPTLYIFLAGLVIGIFIGWSLSGVISLLFKVLMVGLVAVLIILAVNFWQKTRQADRDATIEATWRDTTGPKSRP